jgi:hypothetical protein
VILMPLARLRWVLDYTARKEAFHSSRSIQPPSSPFLALAQTVNSWSRTWRRILYSVNSKGVSSKSVSFAQRGPNETGTP